MRPQMYADNDPSVLFLSPSGLGTLLECEACFVLEKTKHPRLQCQGKNVVRPRGIFPGLPSGMDSILKSYHDTYRKEGVLPPYLNTKVPGILYRDCDALKKMQYWKSGPRYETVIDGQKVVLRGAIDDLIARYDDMYSTFDFKTKGKEPKDDGSQYYQTQLDCYELMLSHNGFAMSGVAFLAYAWPDQASSPSDLSSGVDVVFNWKVYPIKVSQENALNLIQRAVTLLSSEKPVGPSPTCEYCRYHHDRNVAMNIDA